MRLIVCGGRDYSNMLKAFEVLDAIHKATPVEVIRQGGASGADRIAAMWAVARNVPCVNYPADWQRWGKGAGPIRNRVMANAGADLLVAFPGGRGTANMILEAKAAGIAVQAIP